MMQQPNAAASGEKKNLGGRPTLPSTQAAYIVMDVLITFDAAIAAKEASIKAQIDELRAYKLRREQIRKINESGVAA